MRIILFTGKGGVGKTTVAAATAIKAARSGLKTLIISTDPAHSLSDALGYSLNPEPLEVEKNLYAQELDVYYSMQKYWQNIRQLMLTVFRWQGVEQVLAEEMSALPGMEEASAFLWIEKYYSEKAFDLIIIDSAPTGETLTLLTLPQVTKWWVTKALPLQRFAIKSIGKLARVTTGIPIDKGYEELEKIFDKLEVIQKIFADHDICSIRLVTNPEKMVLNETKRAYTYLNLYGYNVDAVIVNRIIEEDNHNSFFFNYIKSQKEYLIDIEESFSELPIFKAKHMGEEIFGTEKLVKFADLLYKRTNPEEVLYNESPYKLENTESGYLLKIKLPFLRDKSYKINKYGDELVLQLGNRRKNIFLPRFVNFYKLTNHEYQDPWLIVTLDR
ncbi:MAG: ArsA family ATPase [Cyclobacteriaceae bacterium]|nr:ArsA family ATPase [Cyclobacteriaceae bacterium]MCK5371136.1 ArsA family ATPase [Cyclobacteriaceae bacterium]MCK5470825.1 ArsA family ATPase [Cyclobacteriaceae bacterium]